jgi:hypothetical protein
MTDDYFDLDDTADDPITDLGNTEGGDGDENADADLAEAQRRVRARATAAQESAEFEGKVERVLNPGLTPDYGDRSPTGLQATFDAMPLGSPEFELLKSELVAIAVERQDAATAAAATGVGPDLADGETEMSWDARDLTSTQFKALTAAATGGSREAPEGILPREWRLYLKRAGIG